ncbi:chromate resistance protein ChrB domain-containing protein [Achromobacter sp. UMC71]|uniref:chromate resistance protein ChrB domain-containing protein n=1 Tax=Achromobacter sp. UMC71 TaxID=1862320 RepID=UPI00160387B6|nr:chromate resistance protein ChrB domain-containing protein [Achromobacter sp. UMC71]MBB1625853.1 chromate resistance protein [Achromobacter sp. UMC71]
MDWLTLILSMPTENATARMRAWRALKSCGAAVLRDGVYLLPARDASQETLNTIAQDVHENGGTAYLARAEFVGTDPTPLQALFDRSADYGELMQAIGPIRQALSADTAMDTLKQLRKLRKTYAQLAEIDFFPGEAQRQANAALLDLEAGANRALGADEPQAVDAEIARLAVDDYQGRVWATRARPWVDRLASAWLIRRRIDARARIVWLASPAACPPDALGFDFDGARFSHVGAKVTFEHLVAAFGLHSPGLDRIGAIVHFLDLGGVQPPEAAGVEQVLAGLRATVADDDQLLALAGAVFDGLLASFEQEGRS